MRRTQQHSMASAEPAHARHIDLAAENAALRQNQVQLESAKAHYADLFELAPAGYCTVCAQGRILQANLAARAMLGVANLALLNAPLMQCVVDADRDLFALHCQRVTDSGEAQSCELRMISAQRGQFWAQLHSSPAQGTDSAAQLRILISDVTARKHSEAASAAAAASASAALAAASGASQSEHTAQPADLTESRLRSEISHELRQPLSALAIYASVLNKHVTPAGEPLLAHIKTCLATLSALLAK